MGLFDDFSNGGSFFDDVGSFLGDAGHLVEQGSALYQQFAGTGTSPGSPATGHSVATVMVENPLSKIPTWVWIAGGGLLIWALARGVRS